MANIDDLSPVDLSGHHIDDAMALVAGAGWNQCADDWRMMMAAGTGFGFEDANGRLVASAMVLPYGPVIGWIGMVLVAPALQGRGLATRLIDRAVALLQDVGLMPCLDATPAGERVYLKRGFHAVFSFQRWHRAGRETGDAGANPVSAVEIATIQTLDRKAFGARRDAMIADVAKRGAPCRITDDSAAFALSRAGRIAHQIGPIVATEETVALELFDEMQGNLVGDVFIDIPDAHSTLKARAETAGFTRQRSFKRMVRGGGKIHGPEAMFALFGPELG